MPNTELETIRARLAASPRPAGLAERRARLDALGAQYALPPDLRVEPVPAAGIPLDAPVGAPAEWTATEAADPSRVILFLHGGGYISGSLASHRHMIAEAGRQARARTLALHYRLAPEHPFPAALEDSLAAYRFLLASGFAPARIALAGESAGGGLALATLISLRDAGLALPAAVWLASPWTDLEMRGATMQTRSAVDPVIQKPYLQELAAAYLAGTDPRAPLVSPIHADLGGLPPTLIQVGAAETLLDDSLRLAAVAGAANVRTTLQIWPEMFHGWHLFFPELGEGRASLAEACAFLRAHLT
ncbi:MAG TPA: alpha/beta hydrolase [Acetobacteraceae bacterium]|nr:alpha/beta hydrolase [Acetobacteraceae bacterium]